MAEHQVSIKWKRETESFKYKDYNRDHQWVFEGGAVVKASAAPSYLGSPELVDPEEAFVASIASCHMLSFLTIAARKRFTVDSYSDAAVGFLEENGGKWWVTRAILRPKVVFSPKNEAPKDEIHQKMHHLAHEQCFIANSVRTDIQVTLD